MKQPKKWLRNKPTGEAENHLQLHVQRCVYGTELDEWLEDGFDLVTAVGDYYD